MPRESKAERAAWTALVTGEQENKPSKFNNNRTKAFDSDHEANVATNLAALASSGAITELEYQVPLLLLEGRGKGRDRIRPIYYICDFRYRDGEGKIHWVDAKGAKTAVYLLKRKLAALLHNIDIEEIMASRRSSRRRR